MAKREVAICTLDEDDGSEVEVGRLRITGGVLVADPKDQPLLEGILDEEITVPDAGGEPRTYRASKDPEAFLDALMRHYRSPYLRACQVPAKHYDPTQPRDPEGQWSETGAEGAALKAKFPKTPKAEIDSAFGNWGATQSGKGDIIGYRAGGGEGKGDKSAATEGIGPYLARDKTLAAEFGDAESFSFPMPKNPLLIKNEPLYMLLEHADLMKPHADGDSPWLAANKEAVRRSGTTDKNWGKKLESGELPQALTDVLLEQGHDAVFVSQAAGKDEWVILLKPKGGGKVPLKKEIYARTREPTAYEAKVDFARVEQGQDALQAEGKARLMEVLERMREALLGVVGKRLEAGELTPTWVRNLDLKFKGELQRVAREILGEGYRLGSREVRRMLQEKRLQIRLVPGLPPEKALAFFEQKAFYITGVLKDRLLNGARNVLYNGIKNGTPSTDVIRELKELFDEYLGDPTAIAPGKEEQAQPYRLETILRTNVNEAYNEGLKDGVDEEVDSGFVIGFLYSAIIDGRQTEVCDFLDGKVLRPDTEDTNALTPSNHFNCRSILIPVTKDEGPVTFITAAQIGRALGLKPKGF
jgi:SPP1 gp7 family putative phage head morphogenesis protein